MSNQSWTSSVTVSRSSWGSKGSQSYVDGKNYQQKYESSNERSHANKSNQSWASSVSLSRSRGGSKGSQSNISHENCLQKSPLYNERSLGNMVNNCAFNDRLWHQKRDADGMNFQKQSRSRLHYMPLSMPSLVSCHNKKNIDSVNRIKQKLE